MTYPSINQHFETLSKDFNQNIPRYVIGTPNPKKPNQFKPIGEDEYNKEIWFSKIEYWIFMIVISIVLGYAGIRLIDNFIK